MGQRLISFKSDLGWRGKSWNSTTDRGERRFIKLENGYVANDGSEIRSMPGMVTLIDLSEENNELGGYARYTIDAIRPIFSTTPNETYQFGYYGGDSSQQTLYARAKPVHFHGFDQVGKEIVVWGESRFREQPLYSSARTQLLVTHVGVIANALVLDFSANIAANSISDATGAALNGADGNDVYFIDGLTVTGDASFQAVLDSVVNGRVFLATGTATNRITFSTSFSNHAVVAVTAGECHRVRPKRTDTYSSGETPYGLVYSSAIDDPDALTAWRILDQPDFDITVVDCFPSWVANRRRDFGDQRDANDVEGVLLGSSTTRGRSRRESRPIPYRTNAEAATDGIVLAAPQYGCPFWIPLGVPTNPDNWPASPDNNQGGIPLVANGQYDQPRALGIPKARMIECSVLTAQPSPSDSGFNFSAEALTGSPDFGFAPGTWTMAIAFEDSAMGWEGLASEPIEVEIPNNTYAYALVPHYLHPGYTFPECLADRVNVYLAGPDEDALTFYASFPLSEVTGIALTAINGTHWNASAVYGFQPMSPETRAIYRKIQLPVLGSNSPIEDDLEAEAERLAPQSAQMPRGCDAVRYVKGVLFSGGQLGNTGGALQLWVGAASAAFNVAATYDDPNGLLIRVHGATLAQPDADQDGIDSLGPEGLSWTTLGIAGRCFPPAYQGIEAISKTLFPGGPSSVQVDKVMNRRTNSLVSQSDAFRANFERLHLTRPIWDRTRVAGSPAESITVEQQDQALYYKMFQGQLQVGDPGAPNRTNLVALQFIDPNRGDDITGIGNLAGNAIICTQRETYSFSWSRNPSAEVSNLVSNQHGCIGANTMVEFDGGLAWLSEKGPCAIGGGLQFIGHDIQEDFINGPERRYSFDSKGMMRHSFGCHDSSRGLVLWGLRTLNDQYVLEHEFSFVPWDTASDGLKSRFPCDEILCWNYRTNAFSTWRLPLRIFWMRMIRIGSGDTVLAALAEDGRIYALLDAATDCLHPPTNNAIHIIEPDVAGDETTTLPINVQCAEDGDATTGRERTDGATTLFLKPGMLVEGFEGEKLRWTTLLSTVDSTGSSGSVTLFEAQTWGKAAKGWTIRIGSRPRMTIVTSYVGGENMDTTSAQGVQIRYSLAGSGKVHVLTELLKSDLTDQTTAEDVDAAPSTEWDYLGEAEAGLIANDNDLGRVSRRGQIKRGQVDGPEIAVRMTFAGDAQIRIGDISLEVA